MENPGFTLEQASTSGTEILSQGPTTIPCVLQTSMLRVNSGHHLAVLGSIPQLGSWDRKYPVVAVYQDGGMWKACVDLPTNVWIEYKWIQYDKVSSQIIAYEPGDNRKIYLRKGENAVMIEDSEDHVQKVHYSFDEFKKPLTDADSGKGNPLMEQKPSTYEQESDEEEEEGDTSVGNEVDSDNAGGVWDKGRSFVKTHKYGILKVGLFTGVAVAAALTYKRLFK